jgi:hypothetical protein
MDHIFDKERSWLTSVNVLEDIGPERIRVVAFQEASESLYAYFEV